MDFRIVEKGGAFGGTWYWNQYPGKPCITQRKTDADLNERYTV
jgi:cation diffusion facilitator CzcD-associated flavoprotein CzcO